MNFHFRNKSETKRKVSNTFDLLVNSSKTGLQKFEIKHRLGKQVYFKM